jgi:hypothetical protein
LVQRVNAHIQTGHFHDADELLEKALDALDEQATAAAPPTATGAVVLAALQARPYPDIDLTPPRVLLSNVGMSCSDGVVAGHEYSVRKAEAKAGTEGDGLL